MATDERKDYSRPRNAAYDPFPMSDYEQDPSRMQRMASTSSSMSLSYYTASPASYFNSQPSSPVLHRHSQLAHYTYGEPQADGDDTPMGNGMPSMASPASPSTTRFQDDNMRRQPSHPPPTSPLPIVQVVHSEPPFGQAGTHVKVVLQVHPSPSHPIRSFRVTFGGFDATTRVGFENRAGSVEHVELVATAPLLQGPLQASRFSLLVQAMSMHENVLASAEAGTFEYVDRALFLVPSRRS
jgi:hypothetical protein